MELKTYYDFAENDYRFIKEVHSKGIMANSLGAMCQNTCERYIKHLINTYIKINSKNQDEITSILSTHNLRRLLSYWNEHSKYPFDEETIDLLENINGYYYSTKYPGDDCQTLDEVDVMECVKAIDACKENVDKIINKLNKD